MKALTVFLCLAVSGSAEDRPALWRDPGPMQSLDFAAGPGGAANAPKPPFRFQEEVPEGITPKVIVTDSAGKKWMVKFGDEAKAETFASRIAWAAGYPVQASYYLRQGRIEGATSLKRAGSFIDGSGSFHSARFQKFYDESFREVPGGKLDLQGKNWNLNHLNGLKLTLLLVSNWDVKEENTAVFDIGGQRYATVSDWGASLGDPGSPHAAARKWNCQAFTARTQNWIDGVFNEYIQFNYDQYAGRNVDAVSANIRVADAKWFLERMGKLTDGQLRTALLASGATSEEASCFASAIRKRLDMLQTVVSTGGLPGTIRTRTVTKTTTRTVQEPPAPEKPE
jgi:hypothetical protein